MIDFKRAYGARKVKVMPRAMIDRRALPQFAAAGSTLLLAKIDAQFLQAGTDKSSIPAATVWLPNIADVAAFNTISDAWEPARASPARACVEARLANPSILRRDRVRAGALKSAEARTL
jgi:L-asparaginase II